MRPRFSWITSIAPAGVSAVARNPCSSPVGPGKVIASPGVEAAGDPDAAAVAEAPLGADDPTTGRVAAGLGEICSAQAASRADAEEAVMPSRISRRTASRRVIRPSTQSSPTSVVRYSRSAMRRTSTSDLGQAYRHRPIRAATDPGSGHGCRTRRPLGILVVVAE